MAGTAVVVVSAGVVFPDVVFPPNGFGVELAVAIVVIVVITGVVLPDVAVVFPPIGFGVVAVEFAFCLLHVSILPAVSLSATLHAPNAGILNISTAFI